MSYFENVFDLKSSKYLYIPAAVIMPTRRTRRRSGLGLSQLDYISTEVSGSGEVANSQLDS
jgi:hypothetical protein